MKILIIGEYLSDNIGDQCIHACMRDLISDVGTPISLDYSGREIQSKGLYKYALRLILLTRFIIASDIVLIGGGQLILGNKYFYRNVLLFKVANIFFRRPYIISFCGIGKDFTLMERFLFNWFIKSASSIILRDDESNSNLVQNFCANGQIFSDVVRIVESKPSEHGHKHELLITPIYSDAYLRYGNEVFGDYSADSFSNFCLEFIKLNSCNKIIIANTDPIDVDACASLKSTINEKMPLIEVEVAINKSLDEFKRINPKNIVTCRMHAGIIFEQTAQSVIYYPFSEKLISAEKTKVLNSEKRSEFREAFLKIVKQSV